jgi:hypothetical protein
LLLEITQAGAEVWEEATGRRWRPDPVLDRTGGPAGNANLTAWTGLVLLVLIAAELVTLIDVGGLVTWHIAIGVLLIPPALLKTASTGWRITRYYMGHDSYRTAGPPPMLLRILGPLVVVLTLAVLGSGLALIALGRGSDGQVLFALLGQQVTAVTIHQVAFIGWGVVTGVHLLARIVPAIALASGRRSTRSVPGMALRVGTLALVLVVAAVTTVLVLGASGAWTSHRERDLQSRHQNAQAP